jgi:hypothetical protein
MKLFTMGEIHRLGLLKNHKGEPYTSKASLVRIIAKLGATEKRTPWGTAKCLTQKQIDSFNKAHFYDEGSTDGTTTR